MVQDQDMDIHHRSGRRHSNADCLSRLVYDEPTAITITDDTICASINSLDVPSLQQLDNELAPIIQILRDPLTPTTPQIRRLAKKFLLTDGILYRKAKKRPLLVIPSRLRADVLHSAHDHPASGHLGFYRTYRRISEKYYWRKLRETTLHYVKTCKLCQSRKTPTTGPQGLLQPLPCTDPPFTRCGMDFLGPFPCSRQKNTFILVCTDYSTKWAETKAIPAASAVEAAAFFIDQVVFRHGAPKELLTDRGTQFMAELTQKILRCIGTRHVKTTSYHPQTNGLTERFNKTLADMLSMYVDQDHSNWDDALAGSTFAYNTAIQESTKASPFYLIYGRDPFAPMDRVLPVSEHPPRTRPVQDARAEALLNISRAQNKQAARYNENRRDVTYKPGQFVYVQKPTRKRGRAEKLLHQHHGPYEVLCQMGPVTYELRTNRAKGRRKTEVVHVSKLKLAHQRDEGYIATGTTGTVFFVEGVNVTASPEVVPTNPPPPITGRSNLPPPITGRPNLPPGFPRLRNLPPAPPIRPRDDPPRGHFESRHLTDQPSSTTYLGRRTLLRP